MTREEETLAIALLIGKQRAGQAPHYIAEQLGAQVVAGDTTGVARWQEIAAAYDQLNRPRQ